MDKRGGGDPGAARQGNFINYYQFNPADNRIKLLDEAIHHCIKDSSSSDSTIFCLDVGCNTGVSREN